MKPITRFVPGEALAATVERRKITARSRDIIAAIHRYKVIPTSMLVRLIPGESRTTKDHLTMLYRKGLVSRFTFSTFDLSEECNYYLSNTEALKVLERYGASRASLDYKGVRRNRKKAPAGRQPIGRIMHQEHELMISRLRFMLEEGSRKAKEPATLTRFLQGPGLHQRVTAPKMRAKKVDGALTWQELDQEEELNWYPDALFSLYFPRRNVELNFLYEADRQTMEPARLRRKMRAHFYAIVKRKLHRRCYGMRDIRAVITETTSMEYAEALRSEIATHPLVCGPKPSSLFWFVPSENFTGPISAERAAEQGSGDRRPSVFLDQPEIIFDRIFASANSRAGKLDTLHALSDPPTYVLRPPRAIQLQRTARRFRARALRPMPG